MPVVPDASDVSDMPSTGNVTSVLEQVLHNDTRSTSLPPYDGALLALTLSQQHGWGSDEARNGSVSSPAAHSSFAGNLDAFFYIIVVLSFYAISIVLLMIKYIRREQEETSLDYYYTEYVKRTWFQRPDVQNRMAMARQGKLLEKMMQREEATSGCEHGVFEQKTLRELKETSL